GRSSRGRATGSMLRTWPMCRSTNISGGGGVAETVQETQMRFRRCVMSEVSEYREISEHPDVAEMRQRYERITASGQAIVIDGLVLLAGAWLALSPWIVHFNTSAPSVMVNNLILGVMVSVIALGLTWAPARVYRLGWALAGLGSH